MEHQKNTLSGSLAPSQTQGSLVLPRKDCHGLLSAVAESNEAKGNAFQHNGPRIEQLHVQAGDQISVKIQHLNVYVGHENILSPHQDLPPR